MTTRLKIVLYATSFFLGLIAFSLLILVYFVKGYKGEPNANLIILGEAGAGYDGASLTDTIMFVSVNSSGTTLLSIPRDIWYEPIKAKINAIYAYGEKDGKGFELVKKEFGKITGQKIDYVVLIDFSVFKDLVDLVGGVDINIENTFTDKKYPIAGKENDLCDGDKEFKCRYEEITFTKGIQHLNGDMALKFSRSRNAEGDEGTDTARAARQQIIISALKNKILAKEFLTNPSKILELKKIADRRMKLDIPKEKRLKLAKLTLNPAARQINSFVLNGWQEENGILYHPNVHSSKLWVLLPQNESYQAIHNYINCLVTQLDKSLCRQS